MKKYIEKWSSFELTGLEMLSSLLKSTTLSLMLLHDQIDVEKAIELSMLEENY